MPQNEPQPPTNPSDPVVLSKFSGLKNTVSPERLSAEELAIAVNIDLDDAGQPHRRRGYVLKDAANYTAAYTLADGRVIAVRNGALCLINPDFTHISLGAQIGNEPLAFVQVAEWVYFSNSTVSGKLLTTDMSVHAWGALDGNGMWLSPVVNPDATLGQTKGVLLGNPPKATVLFYWNGRIYMANGKTLWATLLYAYDFVDRQMGFKQFETDIQVGGSVTDGYYIGTQDGIWWTDGLWKDQKRVPTQAGGAIFGTLVTLPAELVNPQVPQDQYSPSKNAVMFMTTAGLVAGLDAGNLFNLTETDYLFPHALTGAAMFRRQEGINQFVTTLNHDGDPQQGARFGDYVEAEILRHGLWPVVTEGVRIGDLFIVDKV
jgi:hypothetical protein